LFLGFYFFALNDKMSDKLAKVLFDFKARKKEELDLKKGDTVTKVDTVNGDWLKGTCNGNTGCFPKSYVVVIDPSNVKSWVIAKFDFDGKGDKISFKKNERVAVLAEVSADWWTGKNTAGEIGLFPSNYVREDIKASAATSATFSSQQLKDAAAAANAARKTDNVTSFQTATLKDFPITFAMPRKNLPSLTSKYAAEENADAKKARADCKAKLLELQNML